MARSRNELRAGLFIVVSLVLVLALVWMIGGGGGLLTAQNQHVVTFELTDDVSGLRVGDDVRIGGVRMGAVRELAVVSRQQSGLAAAEGQEDMVVRIVISLPQQHQIRDDAVVRVQTTLTGQAQLNFESLGRGQPLAPGEPLAGQPDRMSQALASLGELAPRLQSIAQQLDGQTVPQMTGLLSDVRGQTVPRINTAVDGYGALAGDARGMVADVREQIPPAAERYHAVGGRAEEMMVEMRDLLGDTKTDFRGTVANLNAATGTVREELPGVFGRVEELLGQLNTTVASAGEAMEDVKRTLENTRDMTATANMVLGGNRGRLDGMIASLKATSDNLKFASSEIRRSPWRLLYRPGRNDIANLNLFDSARHFAEGANDVNDAAQALRDALQTQATEPERVQALLDDLERTFGRFREAEEKLWVEIRE